MPGLPTTAPGGGATEGAELEARRGTDARCGRRIRSPPAVDAVEEPGGGASTFRPSLVRIDHRAFLSLNWADDTSRGVRRGHVRNAILSTQRRVSSDDGEMR